MGRARRRAGRFWHESRARQRHRPGHQALVAVVLLAGLIGIDDVALGIDQNRRLTTIGANHHLGQTHASGHCPRLRQPARQAANGQRKGQSQGKGKGHESTQHGRLIAPDCCTRLDDSQASITAFFQLLGEFFG